MKKLVIDRLKEAGFLISEDGTLHPPLIDKEGLRQIHRPASQLEIITRQDWLRRHLPEYLPFFANGEEIIPEHIEPILVEVTTEQQHNLFRVARLLWSIPFSKGYGRRLRFLIMDRANNKLIGLLALQSPPLSFPARDRLFRYPPGRKTEMVNQTMDIQTLGAVPPYDRLLGGKLVALIAASNEIRQVYWHKYSGRATEMAQRILPPHLVALTTTSAFGRSSLYNRLRYNGIRIAESLGYTEGYGTFHLMELYPLFRRFLESQGISTRGGFGTGPRRKWQTMVRALDRLGLSSDLLRHGIKREVFLFRLVDNLEAYMEGRDTEPAYRNLPFSDLVTWWRERWLLPRAERMDGWRKWRKEEIKSLLLIEQDKAAK
ncbi:Druantia anti-phage system protein DruA [Thermanaerothrix daxensis]|uniref:Druantia anti-phage system protein DruA n=1 Tax=Thermanaerothrix daxensis TaxID=869279 RepID=UPI00191C5A8D|nr:Druantia anti-phage system protein DruA [Thermanaerothrix daxensis]